MIATSNISTHNLDRAYYTEDTFYWNLLKEWFKAKIWSRLVRWSYKLETGVVIETKKLF